MSTESTASQECHQTFRDVSHRSVATIDVYRKAIGAAGNPRKCAAGIDGALTPAELEDVAKEYGPGEYQFYAIGEDGRRLRAGAHVVTVPHATQPNTDVSMELIGELKSLMRESLAEQKSALDAIRERDDAHSERVEHVQRQAGEHTGEMIQRITEMHAREREQILARHEAELAGHRADAARRENEAADRQRKDRQLLERRLDEREEVIRRLNAELEQHRRDRIERREQHAAELADVRQELLDARAEARAMKAEHKAELEAAHHGSKRVNDQIRLMQAEHEIDQSRKSLLDVIDHPILAGAMELALGRFTGGAAPSAPPRNALPAYEAAPTPRNTPEPRSAERAPFRVVEDEEVLAEL